MTKKPSTSGFIPTIFILALDNDQAGRATARTLRQIFNDLNFYNVIAQNIYGNFKDANDALVDNREKFSDAVKKIAESARENFLRHFEKNF